MPEFKDIKGIEDQICWIDVVILGLGLFILTFGLGDYGLYEPHEGHFAGVAQEMRFRGDWITPTLNGSPYLNKPPLLYWLIALSMAIGGISEYSARLPLALAGWLGVVLAWKWAGELWGIEAGRIAACFLSTSLGWFLFTRQLLPEILLSTLLLSVYYCTWRSLVRPQSGLNFFLLYGSLAGCLLTKGLLGLVLASLPVISLVGYQRDWQILRKLRLIKGIVLTLALTMPWFLATEWFNPGFIRYFLINEHAKRLLDIRWPPDYTVSKVGIFGYLGLLAIWCLPWSFFFPYVCSYIWKALFQPRSLNGYRGDRHALLLLFIAAISPVLLFLPVSARLVYYSLPAVAPYLILCSGWWTTQNNTKALIIGRSWSIIGVFLLILSILPFYLTKFWYISANYDQVVVLAPPFFCFLGLGFLLAGVTFLRRNRQRSLIVLSLGVACAYLLITVGFARFEPFRSSRLLIEQATTCLKPETTWIFEGSRELGAAGAISYYLYQNQQLPLNKADYPMVLVLSDGGANRLLPNFPGEPPRYMLRQQEMRKLWQQPRPVVFLTDFLRQPDDPNDPREKNLPNDHERPLLAIAQRQLHGNLTARKQWLQAGCLLE